MREFDEWWSKYQRDTGQQHTSWDEGIAANAWDHQQARIDALTAALKSIANPIAYLQQEAEREGYRINGGAAVSLASDAEFLKGLAKTALLEAEK